MRDAWLRYCELHVTHVPSCPQGKKGCGKNHTIVIGMSCYASDIIAHTSVELYIINKYGSIFSQ